MPRSGTPGTIDHCFVPALGSRLVDVGGRVGEERTRPGRLRQGPAPGFLSGGGQGDPRPCRPARHGNGPSARPPTLKLRPPNPRPAGGPGTSSPVGWATPSPAGGVSSDQPTGAQTPTPPLGTRSPGFLRGVGHNSRESGCATSNSISCSSRPLGGGRRFDPCPRLWVGPLTGCQGLSRVAVFPTPEPARFKYPRRGSSVGRAPPSALQLQRLASNSILRHKAASTDRQPTNRKIRVRSLVGPLNVR